MSLRRESRALSPIKPAVLTASLASKKSMATLAKVVRRPKVTAPKSPAKPTKPARVFTMPESVVWSTSNSIWKVALRPLAISRSPRKPTLLVDNPPGTTDVSSVLMPVVAVLTSLLIAMSALP